MEGAIPVMKPFPGGFVICQRAPEATDAPVVSSHPDPRFGSHSFRLKIRWNWSLERYCCRSSWQWRWTHSSSYSSGKCPWWCRIIKSISGCKRKLFCVFAYLTFFLTCSDADNYPYYPLLRECLPVFPVKPPLSCSGDKRKPVIPFMHPPVPKPITEMIKRICPSGSFWHKLFTTFQKKLRIFA